MFGPSKRMVTSNEVDVGPGLVTLHDDLARDPSMVGSKASALAYAASLGLPVLPGFVLTVPSCSAIAGERWFGLRHELTGALRAAWEGMSHDGARPLVVRSSSTSEDGVESSMAGMFRSVLGVSDWMAFLDALGVVLASAFERSRTARAAPMAVLVQPQLEPARGGVLFGVDPLSGRADRLALAAVRGGPDKLVSGAVQGSHYTLTRRGRVVADASLESPRILERDQFRALARLAAAARAAFGVAQDIEWAFDVDGQLWLLQSRPITRVADARPPNTGPILGPGPIAETFPGSMAPLEQELWLEPLRDGARQALLLTGAFSRKAVVDSPVVVCVKGRPAADLALLGPPRRPQGLLRRLDPRPPARRLRASWRVGKLRAALPASVRAMVAQVDSDLATVPTLSRIGTDALLRLLHNARGYLVALHANEMLMGLLLDHTATSVTAASAALDNLAEGRREGLSDREIEHAHPEVLALIAPQLFRDHSLPDIQIDRPDWQQPADQPALLREALRVRARWVQELMARATEELAARAVKSGALHDPRQISRLALGDMRSAVAGIRPADLATRTEPPGPPLPAAFTLVEGTVVAVPTHDNRAMGAAPGRVEGTISHDPGSAGADNILVTRTLDPSLASRLPQIAGLVAETGSLLSHLAILAREFQVPTVVGYQGALEHLPAGCRVLIDGSTGEVSIQNEAQT